jgi:hypothetical protein
VGRKAEEFDLELEREEHQKLDFSFGDWRKGTDEENIVDEKHC